MSDRKVGDCLNAACKHPAVQYPVEGGWSPRGWCAEHLAERERAIATQGDAFVLQISDYERDPETGRVRRRSDD